MSFTGGSLRNGTHTLLTAIPGRGFFGTRKNLRELTVSKDMTQAVRGVDAVVFAVRHEPYLALLADDLMEMTGKPVAVIDCFGILSDKESRCHLVLWTRSEGAGAR
jgi:hypothetical protein